MVAGLQRQVQGQGARLGELEGQVETVSTTLAERERDIEGLQQKLEETNTVLNTTVARYEQQVRRTGQSKAAGQ